MREEAPVLIGDNGLPYVGGVTSGPGLGLLGERDEAAPPAGEVGEEDGGDEAEGEEGRGEGEEEEDLEEEVGFGGGRARRMAGRERVDAEGDRDGSGGGAIGGEEREFGSEWGGVEENWGMILMEFFERK